MRQSGDKGIHIDTGIDTGTGTGIGTGTGTGKEAQAPTQAHMSTGRVPPLALSHATHPGGVGLTGSNYQGLLLRRAVLHSTKCS